MTLADIHFAYGMDFPKLANLDVDLTKYPKLQEIRDKVYSDPKIAEWIKNRPQTNM